MLDLLNSLLKKAEEPDRPLNPGLLLRPGKERPIEIDSCDLGSPAFLRGVMVGATLDYADLGPTARACFAGQSGTAAAVCVALYVAICRAGALAERDPETIRYRNRKRALRREDGDDADAAFVVNDEAERARYNTLVRDALINDLKEPGIADLLRFPDRCAELIREGAAYIEPPKEDFFEAS